MSYLFKLFYGTPEGERRVLAEGDVAGVVSATEARRVVLLREWDPRLDAAGCTPDIELKAQAPDDLCPDGNDPDAPGESDEEAR